MKCGAKIRILTVVLAIIAALTLCGSLTGCGKDRNERKGSPEEIAREDGFGSEMPLGTLINFIG